MEYKNMEDPEQRRKEMHRFYDLFLPGQHHAGHHYSTIVLSGFGRAKEKTSS